MVMLVQITSWKSSWCGGYDDDDFISNEMCCACGGFTANQMCCDCGGGFTWDLGSFDEEWDASAPYCYDDTGNGQLNSVWMKHVGILYYVDESFCARLRRLRLYRF